MSLEEILDRQNGSYTYYTQKETFTLYLKSVPTPLSPHLQSVSEELSPQHHPLTGFIS